MTEDKAKRTALVTGGSRGIGKAITLELLNAGLKVYICGRTLKDLKNTSIELSQYGEIDYLQLDIGNRALVERFVGEWEEPLNVLINNAGICGIEKLEDDFGLWDNILNTNLNGVYYLTKGLLKWIKNGGSIINISSQLGMEGRAGFGAYCASKHALLGLTKCWARELGAKDITVNAICPGWVNTEMAMEDVRKMARERNVTQEEMCSEITRGLDLGRLIEPHEIAYLTAFLVSNKGRCVTGQCYLIN